MGGKCQEEHAEESNKWSREEMERPETEDEAETAGGGRGRLDRC